MPPSPRVRSTSDLVECLGGTNPKRVSKRPSFLLPLVWVVAVLVGLGCGVWVWRLSLDTNESPIAPRSGLWTTYAGAYFTPEPAFPDLYPPDAKLIQVPDFPGAFAIWGAIGRAADGHIWFSAASHDVDVQQSAHLFEYDPETDVVTPRGDALSELKRLGLYRTGEQQVKIHTKILQGADDYLYFATTDDPPNRDTELIPKWGSHLWRYKPGAEGWEHLLSASEGFIALAGNGELMYGLLYPNHILLQYNIRTGATARVTVGSVEGHVSRHFLCDHAGHAYVPRLKMVRADHAEHTLVEFDTKLQQVLEHPLPYYQSKSAKESHGIIAYQPMADRSIAFTTQTGRLFRLHVADRGPSWLEDIGWFHPNGESYASGLFTFSGERHLVGAAEIAGKWDWVCYDLSAKHPTAIRLLLSAPEGLSAANPFLYGCTTRDNTGDFYLVGGIQRENGRPAPIVVRLRTGT